MQIYRKNAMFNDFFNKCDFLVKLFALIGGWGVTEKVSSFCSPPPLARCFSLNNYTHTTCNHVSCFCLFV